MRKVWIFFWVFLISLLALSSCLSEKKKLSEYEADPKWLHLGAVAAQHKDTLYFVMSLDRSRLLYEDLEHGDAGYLCGRPECSHETAECNAYLGTEEASAGYMAAALGLGGMDDGIGYVFMDGADISAGYMKADGSGHEVLRHLASAESSSFPLNGGIPPFFHRGYVFACGQTSEIVNGMWVSTNKIMAYPLNTKDEEITVFSEEFTQDFGGLLIYPDGNQIWYALTGADAAGNSGTMDVHLRVCIWDLDSKVTKTVFDGNIPAMVYEWTIAEDGIFFTSAADDAIYRLDPSGQNFELFRRFDEGRSGFMTMCLSGEYVVGFEFPSAGMQRIRVEDLQGNEIADCTGEQLPVEGGRAFLGIADDRLFYHTMSWDGQAEALIEFSLKSQEKKTVWSQ